MSVPLGTILGGPPANPAGQTLKHDVLGLEKVVLLPCELPSIAFSLAELLSFFVPQSIAISILTEGPDDLIQWPSPMREVLNMFKNPAELDSAISALESLSIIRRSQSGSIAEPVIEFHGLFHAVVRFRVHHNSFHLWLQLGATILSRALKNEAGCDARTWTTKYQLHVLSVLKHLKTDPKRVYQPFFSIVLSDLGLRLRDFYRYAEAVDMLHLAAVASTNDVCYGPDHPHTLALQEQYANLCAKIGQYGAAGTAYNQVQQKRGKLLGWLHPDTVRACCNIATLLGSQGRYEDSAKMFWKAELLMRCSSMKRPHPSSHDLSCIREGRALALWRLGQDRKAKRLLEGVLAVRQEASKATADNRESWDGLQPLVDMYCAQGQHDSAESVCRQILQQAEKRHDGKFSETMLEKLHLANVMIDQGKDTDAREIISASKRTLESGDQRTFDPTSLPVKERLADALAKLGDNGEAAKYYDTVYQERKTHFGSVDPTTLRVLTGSARVKGKLGLVDEARALFDLVVQGCTNALGRTHPQTLESLQMYGEFLVQTGSIEEASTAFSEVLTVRKKRLRKGHPDTLRMVQRLANCAEKLQR